MYYKLVEDFIDSGSPVQIVGVHPVRWHDHPDQPEYGLREVDIADSHAENREVVIARLYDFDSGIRTIESVGGQVNPAVKNFRFWAKDLENRDASMAYVLCRLVHVLWPRNKEIAMEFMRLVTGESK